MELVGKTTINPLLFYTGKTAGYLTWLVWWRSTWVIISNTKTLYNHQIARVFLAVGMIFIVISLFNLGKSVRVGLPSDNTTLKIRGILQNQPQPDVCRVAPGHAFIDDLFVELVYYYHGYLQHGGLSFHYKR